MKQRGAGFWLLQLPGWALLTYLVYAQGLAAFDYDLGVRMGTQESAQQITEVGAAFWWGFAFADLIIYVPLLAAGLIGNWNNVRWGNSLLAAALGITIYWPIVALAAAVDARTAAGWTLDESRYWAALPVIAGWGAWALWWIARHPGRREQPFGDSL